MKIKLLCDDIISVKPMSKEEYEKHHKKAVQEWALLDKIYTRRVIVEKWKPSKYIVYGYTR
jgi:hypothetical protein